MMQRVYRSMVLILALAVTIAQAAAAEPRFLSQKLLDEGWLELFNGKTLAGWQPTGGATWTVVDGTVVTKGEKPGWLMTTSEWADFELHVEFKAPAATNSGVFLRSPLSPTDPTKDCVELNIAPQDNPFPTASLVGRCPLSTQPQQIYVGDTMGSGFRPVGEPKGEIDAWDGKWHAFDVVIEGGSARISLDGQCLDTVLLLGQTPRRGHIGLQAKEGEVAFRNVRIREIRGP
ncbi:MAG: DUF1080 domain-containing protein [Pirellulales bacterium]